MNKKNRKIVLITFLICLSFLGSCKTKQQKVEFYDSHYYRGLEFLQKGQIQEAKKSFELCYKKGSYFCSRKSGEELSKIGGIQERQKFCLDFINKFPDENAKVLLLKEFYDNKEFSDVIKYSKNIDYSESQNELIFLQFSAMAKKNYENFTEEIEKWFTTRLISKFHYEFYKNYILQEIKNRNNQISDENIQYKFVKNLSDELLNLVNFRILVYRGSYKNSYQKIPEIAEKYLHNDFILSDVGKSCLYGSSNFLKDAQFFKNLSEKVSTNSQKFYSNFYAGRMFEKSGNRLTQSMNHFETAMKSATSGSQFDNALWYYFDSALNISTEKALFAVKKYYQTWDNPEYFEDFFEVLTPILISEKKWQIFGEFYKNLEGFASDSVISKFAYLYARAIQEGFITFADKAQSENEINSALNRALKSGNEPYYKIMALNQLKLDRNSCEKVLVSEKTEFNFEKNQDAENYLLGFVKFGMADKIYSEYLNFIESDIKISLDTALKLSEFLQKSAKNNKKFYSQSLRLASKAILNSERDLKINEMKYFYPENFKEIVKSSCKKYNLPEENLYALIRTESFFDPEIKSYAGAVGLTQLMESTANDIARKLKWKDFDLQDSFQNVEMGAFYLEELIERLDGKILLAFFSYNAGITKVRRWVKNSEIELEYLNSSKSKKLPLDLFLETIPYQETRGYGRKLTSASVYYGFLYKNKNVSDIVEKIF